MLIRKNRVIVEDAVCAGDAVHTKRVHHRDFPEIRAECGSVAEGVAYLAGQLSCARDGVQSQWHHELIDRALADVTTFLETLAEAGQDREVPCRHVAHVPVVMVPGFTGRCSSV